MSEHIFTRAEVEGFWNLTTRNVPVPARAAVPGVVLGFRATGTAFTVAATPDLDVAQEAALAAAVTGVESAFNPVPEAQAAKVQDIRDHTAELIAQGTVWAGDGQVYGSTQVEREYIHWIFLVIDSLAIEPVFPVRITSSDNRTIAQFDGALAFLPFFTAVAESYLFWGEGEGVLVTAVLAATTVAEVDAVVDNRTWPAP